MWVRSLTSKLKCNCKKWKREKTRKRKKEKWWPSLSMCLFVSSRTCISTTMWRVCCVRMFQLFVSFFLLVHSFFFSFFVFVFILLFLLVFLRCPDACWLEFNLLCVMMVIIVGASMTRARDSQTTRIIIKIGSWFDVTAELCGDSQVTRTQILIEERLTRFPRVGADCITCTLSKQRSRIVILNQRRRV